MATNKRSSAAVVTEGAAQAALRRGPAKELHPEEEKVLRMRLGASPPRTEPLERAGETTDLEIEVRAAEIEAFMRWREREEERGVATQARPVVPSFSQAKAKIVRALRRK